MSPSEAEQFIRDNISITRQRVTLAKAFALQHFRALADPNDPEGSRVDEMIRRLLIDRNTLPPDKIAWGPAEDPTPELHRAAEAISWRVAAYEAVWDLVHTGKLFIHDAYSPFAQSGHSVSWNFAGNGAGWQFKELALCYPTRLRCALSSSDEQTELLTNPDLYLQNLGMENIHDEVREALEEAVTCFRHELFTACVVMLAKSSEQVWINLGVSLLSMLPGDQSKKVAELTGPDKGILAKMNEVMKLCDKPEIIDLLNRAEVPKHAVKSALQWSDVLRESRNVIHPGAVASTPNTYEKVAALLLGAVPHFRYLYRIQQAATKAH